MARRKRKKSAGKRRKKSRAVAKKRSPGLKRKRKLRRRRAKTVGGKVSSAYRTVVDTIKGTDQLRNKLELPSTSETE